MSAIDSPASAGWRAQASARWAAMSPKERLGVGVAAAVIGLAVVWLIAVQPALRTLQEAPRRMEALDSQWQRMQRLATEARELRAIPPVPASQITQVLQGATDRLQNRARLTVQGDRATLTITSGISGDAVRGWLAEVRSGARARTVELRLTRGPEGYTGSIIVGIGGGS